MDNRALVETAHRVVRALKRGDWNAFCQECTPTIVFQEYSRAYSQDYPKGLYDRVFGGGFLFNGHSTDYAMNVRSWSIKISTPLSREDHQLFRNFCHVTSRNSFGPGGMMEVNQDLADDDEARFLNGPAIRGRIASNAEWRIQMELRNGKWKVRSLIVASH